MHCSLAPEEVLPVGAQRWVPLLSKHCENSSPWLVGVAGQRGKGRPYSKGKAAGIGAYWLLWACDDGQKSHISIQSFKDCNCLLKLIFSLHGTKLKSAHLEARWQNCQSSVLTSSGSSVLKNRPLGTTVVWLCLCFLLSWWSDQGGVLTAFLQIFSLFKFIKPGRSSNLDTGTLL